MKHDPIAISHMTLSDHKGEYRAVASIRIYIKRMYSSIGDDP